jgi:hypothetical protein
LLVFADCDYKKYGVASKFATPFLYFLAYD